MLYLYLGGPSALAGLAGGRDARVMAENERIAKREAPIEARRAVLDAREHATET